MTTGPLRRALTAVLALGALACAAPGAWADPALLLNPVVEPANPDAVWLPAIGGPGDEFTESTVSRSRDGGATFVEILRATFSIGYPADVSVSSSGVAYVALDRRTVRRSVDGGATWHALPPLQGVIDVAVGPPPSETVFAVVSSLEGAAAAPSARRIPRELLCAEPVVGGAEAPARAGVYRLEGGAWRQVLYGDVDVVHVHPTDPAVVVAIGSTCDVYRSSNGGATFTRVTGEHPPVDALVFDPARPGALLGLDDDGVVLASYDAATTWQRIGTAPRLSWLAQPAADRPGRIIATVRPAGNDDVPPSRLVVSEDFGLTWRELWRAGAFGVSTVAIAPSDSTRVYATTPFALLRSDDGGATWSAHGQPLDGRGPALALAAQTLGLRPTLGGRRPASVHVPLVALTADEHPLGAVVRIAFRFGGRLQTAGVGGAPIGRRSGTVPVQLTRAAARAVRAEGSVDALVRIRGLDDAGQERVRWEPVTLTG